MTHPSMESEDEAQLRTPARNLFDERDGFVHYYDTGTEIALQIRCGWFSIREEFQWTSEPVNCLSCLAMGPRP